ncbi:hypothetical protein GCM10007981_14170 [Thermocladium modestius]|uniref:Uncharacterized protein n=1 Tax=Thermocladium modestius TaxID=62609 RepID=A0A830GXD6_9CREN|nr:hypothetical protein [Thermocladium modestius]GGP21620.1 hypothetical protein GCM10007981_14170 [Thermocladium modestius]
MSNEIDIESIEGQLRQVQRSVASLSNELASVNKLLEETKESIKSLENTIQAGSKVSVTDLLRELAYLETGLLAYRDQISRASNQLSELVAQLSTTANEFNEIKVMMFSSLDEMRNGIAAYEKTIKDTLMLVQETQLELLSRIRKVEDGLELLKSYIMEHQKQQK